MPNFFILIYLSLFLVPSQTSPIADMESWYREAQDHNSFDEESFHDAHRNYKMALIDIPKKEAVDDDVRDAFQDGVPYQKREELGLNTHQVGTQINWGDNRNLVPSSCSGDVKTLDTDISEPKDSPDLTIGMVEVMQFGGAGQHNPLHTPGLKRHADISSETSKQGSNSKKKHDDLSVLDYDAPDSNSQDSDRVRRQENQIDMQIRPFSMAVSGNVQKKEIKNHSKRDVDSKDHSKESKNFDQIDKEYGEKVVDTTKFQFEKADLQRKEVKNVLRESEAALEKAKAFEAGLNKVNSYGTMRKAESNDNGKSGINSMEEEETDLEEGENDDANRKKREHETEEEVEESDDEENNDNYDDEESDDSEESLVEAEREQKRNVELANFAPKKSNKDSQEDEEDEEIEEDTGETNINLQNAPVEHAETQSRGSNTDDNKRERKGAKIWDQWSKWSPCSVTCGVGKQTRWRHCVGGGCAQGEKEAQIKTCTNPAC